MQLLLKEDTGILAWLVQGAIKYFAEGLQEPKAITDAIIEYREEEDALARWINERCEISENANEVAVELWNDYQDFCREEEVDPGKKRAFYRELEARGYERFQSTGNKYRFRGIGFKGEAEFEFASSGDEGEPVPF